MFPYHNISYLVSLSFLEPVFHHCLKGLGYLPRLTPHQLHYASFALFLEKGGVCYCSNIGAGCNWFRCPFQQGSPWFSWLMFRWGGNIFAIPGMVPRRDTIMPNMAYLGLAPSMCITLITPAPMCMPVIPYMMVGAWVGQAIFQEQGDFQKLKGQTEPSHVAGWQWANFL